MQKLVWQNANGDEINLTGGNYGITKWEGFSNAPLNIQNQQVPFQDGAVFLDALIEPRELSVTLKMQDKGNLEERYRMRRELIHILNPKLGEGYLIYTNDFISKRIKCIPQIPLFETHNSDTRGTPKASLAWTACEPYWEDLEETRVTFKQSKTIVNNGDVPCYIKAKLNINSKNPMLYNKTNQKEISINGTFSNNVFIDTNIGKKKVEAEELGFGWLSGGNFNDCCYGQGKILYVGDICVIEEYFTGKRYSVDINETTIYGAIYCKPLGLFVAVGGDSSTGNIISTSTDGITWTIRSTSTGLNSAWKDVVYSESLGLFVAVANGFSGSDIVRTSPDGITWTTRHQSGSLEKVVYSETLGLFVAVGASGKILTSADGTTWTSQTSGVSISLNGVCYDDNNNLFVVVGASGTILTSSNGTEWVSRTSGTSKSLLSTRNFNSIGLFISVGQGGTTVTSLDGITWILKIASGATTTLQGIIYAKGMFVTIGDNGYIASSADGISWTERTSGVSTRLNGVTYSDNADLFVIAGESGVILTSPDGITWTRRTSGTTRNLMDIIYVSSSDLFVIVGAADTTLTSSDGITWTSITNSGNLLSVVYSEILGLFVAVGKSGRIRTSPDGITWTTRTNPLGGEIRDVTFSETLGLFVAVGVEGQIATSLDGINWVKRNSGTDKYLWCVGYSDIHNLFVIGGAVGTILTSPDGINWTPKSSGINNLFHAITESQQLQLFVIIGNNGIVLNSYISDSDIENIISFLTPQSDMTFNLEKGENEILFLSENNSNCTLTYRQKYLGV